MISCIDLDSLFYIMFYCYFSILYIILYYHFSFQFDTVPPIFSVLGNYSTDITISGEATSDEYRSLLSTVLYKNTASEPNNSLSRHVYLQLSDLVNPTSPHIQTIVLQLIDDK